MSDDPIRGHPGVMKHQYRELSPHELYDALIGGGRQYEQVKKQWRKDNMHYSFDHDRKAEIKLMNSCL